MRAHSIGRPEVSLRTNSRRFKSHRMTVPSDDAESRVEKLLLTAKVITGVLCPKSEDNGCKVTGLEGDVMI